MLREETPTEVLARTWTTPLAAWVLLLVTATPWGATEQVGGLVAAVKVAGFAVAVGLAYLHRRRPTPLGLAAWLLLGYAAVAAVGAYVAEEMVTDSLMRSARLAATVAAAVWLVGRLGLPLAMRAVAGVASVVSAVAVAGFMVGFGNAASGRLNGLLPPLGPNSLGAIAAIGLILAATSWLRGDLRPRFAVLQTLALAPALLLTQSRTAALAAGLGLLAALLLGRPVRSVAVMYAAVLTGAVGVLLGINPLSGSRYEWDSTFSGRTTGWDYVTDLQRDSLAHLFGDGLAFKYVPDSSVFGVGVRPVDGSWHSAYLQAGVIGLTFLGLAVLLCVWRAASSPKRRAVLPLLVFLAASATLESSLNDVTFQLVVLAALAAIPERGGEAMPATAPGEKAPGDQRQAMASVAPLFGRPALAWTALTVLVAAISAVMAVQLLQ